MPAKFNEESVSKFKISKEVLKSEIATFKEQAEQNLKEKLETYDTKIKEIEQIKQFEKIESSAKFESSEQK